jgi:hypothetical protein
MISFTIGFILGFAAGALFARRNLAKVELAVEEAKVEASKLKAQLDAKLKK